MGCWLVRAMSVGETRDRRVFGTRVLQRIAELLPGTPVGFFSDGRQLVHPRRDAIEAAAVGRVLDAWYAPHVGDLLATLAIADGRIERRLSALERDGRLRLMGISPMFVGDPVFRPDRSDVAEVVDVAGVASLDLVSRPAGVGCCVLRSWREGERECPVT